MTESPPRRLRYSATPEGLVLLAAVFFALFANGPFWGRILEGRPGSLHLALFVLATFGLLVAAHVLLLLPLAFRRVVRPALSLMFVVTAVVVHAEEQFGVFLTRSMMRNVLQTDAREATELFSLPLVVRLLLMAGVPILLLWRSDLRPEPFRAGLRRKGLLGAAALGAIVLGFAPFFGDYVSFFRNQKNARYLVAPGNVLVSTVTALAAGDARPSGPRSPVGLDAARDAAGAAQRPLLFVVVVGETARSETFSLNGYGRETNPLLSKRGVVSWRDAWACGTDTAESLPCMFSLFGRSKFDDDETPRQESFLDVAKRAGVRVVWIDNNSGCKGVCDGVESERRDRWTTAGLCRDGECWDEVLLEDLDRVLGPPQDLLLVLHQKGSHGPAYFRRYPDRFKAFVPACETQDLSACSHEEIVNAYDNTIVYTDFLLDRVISFLEARSGRYDTAMLYVSDHGESTGEGGLYLHGLPYAIAPERQKKIPMIFWMSEPFAARTGIRRERLLEQAGARASHDHLPHTVLGTFGIRTSVYRRDLDLFAPLRGLPLFPPPPAPGESPVLSAPRGDGAGEAPPARR